VIAIIVVIVVLVLCCFGIGTFIICSYQVSKASKQVNEI
jgi:flagellar basal body-associated protein FliL